MARIRIDCEPQPQLALYHRSSDSAAANVLLVP